MIDYQKHRDRLDAVKSYPEMNYEWRRAREEASDELYNDADELIRLAELGAQLESMSSGKYPK